MPATLTFPGVYIEEIPSGVRTITGVATSITAFIGSAVRGPVEDPVSIFSFGDYERSFGPLSRSHPMSYAVSDFYLNGGSQAVIVRLAGKDATTAEITVGGLTLTAASPGVWGQNLSAAIDLLTNANAEATKEALGIKPADTLFTLKVTDTGPGGATEVFPNLTVVDSPRRVDKVLLDGSQLVRIITVKDKGAFDPKSPPTITSGADASTVQRTALSAATAPRLLPPAPPPAPNAAAAQAASDAAGKKKSDADQALAKAKAVTPLVQADVDAAQEAADAASLDVATAALDLANANLAVAQATLAAALAVSPQVTADVTKAQAAVKAAQTSVTTNATAANGAAAAKKKTADANLGTAQTALTAAQTALTTAQAATPPVAATVTTAQTALTTAQTTVDNAQAAVDAASADVATAALNNANAILAAALAAAVPAPATIKAAQDAVVAANATLATTFKAAFASAPPTSSDGGPLTAAEYDGNTVNKKGIFALEKTDLFNLLCIPPPSLEEGLNDTPPEVYQFALPYCVARRAMLLVDPPSNWKSAADITADTEKKLTALNLNGTDARNAAVYYPRVLKPDILQGGMVGTFVPCGIVAGVMSRTDSQRGVWKAPAGLDASLNGIAGLVDPMTNGENGLLNPLGVNCLRTFPIIGSVVWGARTLRGADLIADEYKYVPVRRLALFIEESLYRGTQWVVFEPNDEPLWAQIRLNIGAFMHNLFRQGAFQGVTPKDAYFVKCDKESTTQNDINLGIVNIIVGFAPLKPAEFVVIKLQQMPGQIDV